MAALFGLFTVSGLAGLLYELVWSRQLTLVFGATTLAVSTVLTTFMFGMGTGSFVAGRLIARARHPLRVYALLELAIALYALAFPGVLAGVDWFHAAAFRALYADFVPLALVRFLLAFLALLPATLLMGATVPVMGRSLSLTRGGLGGRAGQLYAWNTLGAALGAGLGGFALIPAVGFRATTLIAATLNLLVALAAWRAGRATEALPDASAPAREFVTGTRWLLACYALSGFAALAYEVILTRVLILAYGSSVYSFAIVLTGFLLGLGGGSLLAARWIDRAPDLRAVVAALQAVIGAGILVTTPLYDRLPEWFMVLWRWTDGQWLGLVALEFTVTLALLLVPTLAMGAMFPTVARVAVARSGGLAGAVGNAYAVNTIGSVLGAFTGGFLLIPALGLQRSLLALAMVNLGLGAALLGVSGWGPRWRRLALAGVLVAAPVLSLGFLPRWDARLLNSGAYVYAADYERMTGGPWLRDRLDRYRLLYYREGVSATVAVFEGQQRFLRVNGKTDAGDSTDNLTQRLLAHLPLLLAPEAREVLVIGLGSGVTLGSALQHPVARVDTIEISPEVIEAARFFERANGGALRDRRVHLRVLDGRTWLTAGSETYDIIISEPSNPWQTGNSNLFTREHFEAVRRRLRAGGLVCQWLPFYRMPGGDFTAALATFRDVFPEMSLWVLGTDVLMIGGLGPQEMDLGRLRGRVGETILQAQLREIGIPSSEALLARFALGPPGIARLVQGSRLRHTDDWPILEFSGPKALFAETVPGNLTAMQRAALEPVPLMVAGGAAGEAEARAGVALEYLALRWPDAALREARRAVEVAARSPEAQHALARVDSAGASSGMRRSRYARQSA